MSDKQEEKNVMQGKILSFENYTNEELIFEIIKEHKPGWQRAYNQLMENTLDHVKKYVQRRERNSNNIDEIIQEIMYKIITTERVFKYTGRNDCKWTTYLFQHIRGWYIFIKEKEARQRKNEPVIFDDEKNMDFDKGISFDMAYAKIKKRLMKHITKREKLVFELKYHEELKQKDIALRLEISEERVSQIVKSIRNKYRKFCKDDYPEVQT